MIQNQIERRRRWIEQIEGEMKRMKEHEDLTSAKNRRRLCLSLLRRVRRCPECLGIGWSHQLPGHGTAAYVTHAEAQEGYEASYPL